MGAVFMMCAMAALGLSLFLSTNPSSFIDYILTTIVRNDIKAFGLRHKGLKDKSTASGLITGGNLRTLKTLSKSNREKLKNSTVLKNMSRDQKERLRKQFGGR